MIQPFHFVLIALAVWRLSNLIANETGPFYIFKTLRSKAMRAEVRSRRKNGFLYRFHISELLSCEYCNSVWAGSFFAAVYLVTPNVALALAFPLALSTGAILIKTVVFVLGGIDTYFDKRNTYTENTQDYPSMYKVKLFEQQKSEILKEGGKNHV